MKSLFNLRLKPYLGNVPNKPSEVKITIFQPDECPESAFLPPTICGGQNDESHKGSCAVSKIRFKKSFYEAQGKGRVGHLEGSC